MQTSETTNGKPEVNIGAAEIMTALRKASGSEPIKAVAIASLALAAIASAADIPRERLLEAIDIAWQQTQGIRD